MNLLATVADHERLLDQFSSIKIDFRIESDVIIRHWSSLIHLAESSLKEGYTWVLQKKLNKMVPLMYQNVTNSKSVHGIRNAFNMEALHWWVINSRNWPSVEPHDVKYSNSSLICLDQKEDEYKVFNTLKGHWKGQTSSELVAQFVGFPKF